MYERMTDKAARPDEERIESFIGAEASARLRGLERRLEELYTLKSELRFPFGESYGWGYKYSHRTAHLCYAFFENGSFTVTVQVGDSQTPVLENVISGMSQKAQRLWENRYPCGERGGWVHYRVTDVAELNDVIAFISAKKAPPGKK